MHMSIYNAKYNVMSSCNTACPGAEHPESVGEDGSECQNEYLK